MKNSSTLPKSGCASSTRQPIDSNTRQLIGREDSLRALLAKPDWLFLDESTGSLDEASEADLYRAIATTLPSTTLVSIGHRSTLNAFHRRRIVFSPRGDALATVKGVAE